MLERLVAAGSKNVPLVAGRRNVVIEPGVPDQTRDYFAQLPSLADLFPRQQQVSAESLCVALAKHLAVNFIGEPSAVLLHHTAFESFGNFQTSMIQLCDLELWARIGVHTGLAVVPDPVATFRIHPGSTSAGNVRGDEYRKDTLDPLVLFHQFAHAEGFEPLRQVAAAMHPRVSFANITASQAERARHAAVQAARNGDASLVEAWNRVSGRYPRMRRSLRLWLLGLLRRLGMRRG